MNKVPKSKVEDMRKILEECREKGITIEDLLKVLSVVDSKIKVADEKSINQRVTDILKELGVPAHIKGYAYVRYAIIYVLKHPLAIEGVTKVLYPEVAKEFGTTSSGVERAIRHAIDVALDRSQKTNNFKKIFGVSINTMRGKPTNSEFIAGIVEYIKNN